MKNSKLLDEVRKEIRLKHFSIRTEQAYVKWILLVTGCWLLVASHLLLVAGCWTQESGEAVFGMLSATETASLISVAIIVT